MNRYQALSCTSKIFYQYVVATDAVYTGRHSSNIMDYYLKKNYVQYIDQKVPKEKEIFNWVDLGLSIQVNTDFVKPYLNTSLKQLQKCFLKGPSTRNTKIQENNIEKYLLKFVFLGNKGKSTSCLPT